MTVTGRWRKIHARVVTVVEVPARRCPDGRGEPAPAKDRSVSSATGGSATQSAVAGMRYYYTSGLLPGTRRGTGVLRSAPEVAQRRDAPGGPAGGTNFRAHGDHWRRARGAGLSWSAAARATRSSYGSARACRALGARSTRSALAELGGYGDRARRHGSP